MGIRIFIGVQFDEALLFWLFSWDIGGQSVDQWAPVTTRQGNLRRVEMSMLFFFRVRLL
jgi:hypothetical protein